MARIISKCELLWVPLALICVALCFGHGSRDSSTGGEGIAGAAEADVQKYVPSAKTAAAEKKENAALVKQRQKMKLRR